MMIIQQLLHRKYYPSCAIEFVTSSSFRVPLDVLHEAPSRQADWSTIKL